MLGLQLVCTLVVPSEYNRTVMERALVLCTMPILAIEGSYQRYYIRYSTSTVSCKLSRATRCGGTVASQESGSICRSNLGGQNMGYQQIIV